MQAAVARNKTDADLPPQSPLRCVKCEQTLSQQRYVLHDGHPYCIHCYESEYANVCTECSQIIATDSKVSPI